MGAKGSGRKSYKEIEQFFREYCLLKGRLLKLKSEQRRILNSGPKPISAMRFDGMPHATHVTNTETELNRLTQVQTEIAELEVTIKEINEIIDTIDVKRADKAYSKILRKYYIDGEDILDIALDLNCSEDSIKKLKAQAISNMMVILKGRQQCKSKFINPEEDNNGK